MRRWFRRKGKDKEREEELEGAPIEETAPGSGVPSDVPEDAAEAIGESEPEAPGVSLFEPEAAAETESTPERRGFFRRFRRKDQEEGLYPEEAVSPLDLPDDIPPEPLTSSEVHITSPLQATPEAGEQISPETQSAEIPEIPAVEDLELPGEVSEVVRRKRFKRLRERLQKTREVFSGRLDRLFKGRKVVDAELFDELEELLITADLGVDTSLFLIQALQDKLKRRELADVEKLKAALKAEMVALLKVPSLCR